MKPLRQAVVVCLLAPAAHAVGLQRPRKHTRVATVGADAAAAEPPRQLAALGPSGKFKFDIFKTLSEESCQHDSRSDTVKHFADSFKTTWAPNIAAGIAAAPGPAYLTVSEGRTEPIFRNWIAQSDRCGQREGTTLSVVNVALDARGFQACNDIHDAVLNKSSKVQLTCVSLAGWLPDEFFGGTLKDNNGGGHGGNGFGSCAYNIILWSKPHILNAAMEASPKGVFMIDTDIILKKHLTPYAQEMMRSNPNVTIVTGQEQGVGGSFWGLNSGTVWVKRPRSDKIMQLWIEQNGLNKWLNDARGDQAALQQVFKTPWFGKHTRDFHFQLAKMPNKIVGQCGVRGEYATHFNCIPNKVPPMKTKGMWDKVAARRIMPGDLQK